MTNSRPAALVTGASKRIGREITLALAGAGYDVAVHYRSSKKEAQTLADEVAAQSPGARAIALQADLEKPDELGRLASAAANGLGGLDLLVNNASYFHRTPLKKLELADIDRAHKVHVSAPAMLSIKAAPFLRKAKPGRIINIVDVFADFPRKDYAPYTVAKAGLKALTRQLALEFAPDILVNAIAPGAILNPKEGISDEIRERIIGKIPMGRFGGPEDITMAVIFLARAGYITGQTIVVDGGRTLNI